jgi:hypothetical protein
MDQFAISPSSAGRYLYLISRGGDPFQTESPRIAIITWRAVMDARRGIASKHAGTGFAIMSIEAGMIATWGTRDEEWYVLA